MAPGVVFTAGYQGRTLDELIELLQAAGVDRVIDVRALARSRKKGFSKKPLGERLAAEGIEYVHLPLAGNPYRGEKDDLARCLALYTRHFDEQPQVRDELARAIEGRRAALLCFEADQKQCHRSVIAKWLETSRRTITHL